MTLLRRTCITGTLVLLTGMTALARSTLSIRLVEASQRVASPSPELADVADILSRNLPFASFTLQAAQTIPLPADRSVALGGFQVTCRGPHDALQVSIQRGGRVLISTILRLNDSTPVILGGFDSPNGKHIFVLMAR